MATKAKARPTTKRKAPPRVQPKKPSTHPAKKRTPTSRAVTTELRAICAELPDTTEVVAWGEPTWRVKGRLYAQLDDHHHGAAHVSVWIPAAPGAQEQLIESDPDRFFRPPYVGHKGWVAIVLDTDPDWDMVGALLAQAHALIRDKKR